MEFELTRASTAAIATPLVLVALLVSLAAMFGWIAWTTTRSAVSLSDGMLQVRVPMYGRRIPVADLDVAAARIVDMGADSPSHATMRTNGIGLPGYSVGWFRLADGSRALMAVTDRSRVVRIPTREGYVLMLSVTDPDRLLAELRSGR